MGNLGIIENKLIINIDLSIYVKIRHNYDFIAPRQTKSFGIRGGGLR